MKFDQINRNSIILEVIDFVVFGFSFLAASFILFPNKESGLLPQALVYAVVILLSIHLGRQLLPLTLSSENSVIQLIVDNAAGLLIGASFLLILGNLFVWSSAITIIVASFIAFFILGTLTPLIKSGKQLSC